MIFQSHDRQIKKLEQIGTSWNKFGVVLVFFRRIMYLRQDKFPKGNLNKIAQICESYTINPLYEESRQMQVTVHDTAKVVAIWLDHADQSDEHLLAKLESVYRMYNTRNYTVAVYYSGSSDLYNQIHDLLHHNRLCLAKQAADQ